jgi:hypothetical protein
MGNSHVSLHFSPRGILGAILCFTLLLQVSAVAQSTQSKSPGPSPAAGATSTKTSDVDMKILLDKLKADKKVVVAANMNLSESEKMTFWPLYDAYQKDLAVINERLVRAIRAYADGYNNNSLTNEQAKKLTDEALAIEADEVKLRTTYAGKMNAVLPGKTVARYIQIESKIRAAIRYDMADSIPLVPTALQ